MQENLEKLIPTMLTKTGHDFRNVSNFLTNYHSICSQTTIISFEYVDLCQKNLTLEIITKFHTDANLYYTKLPILLRFLYPVFFPNSSTQCRESRDAAYSSYTRNYGK